MVGVDELTSASKNFEPCREDVYNVESFESFIYL
jgi:hypothetical protein